MKSQPLPHWAWPAAFVLIWSSGYIVARYGMPHGPPFTFLAIRFAASSLCFGLLLGLAFALTRRRQQWPQGSSQWLHLAVVGVLMQAGYLGGVWAAVKAGIGAGLVALIVNFQPVLTAIWVSKLDGTAVTRRQWAGLCVGFMGLVLVMSRKFGAGGEATALNVGLSVLALLSMTAGALYQKHFVRACDVRCASIVQLMAGLAVMLPLAVWELEPMQWSGAWFGFNGELLGAMAFSVLVLTLGGSSLLYLLLQRGQAMQVTSLLYLVPPVTALMAWSLFGETLTAWSLVGMALVVAGLVAVMRPSAEPR